MKVCIFGSRHMPWESRDLIPQALAASNFNMTEEVCGMANGADIFGGKYARSIGIPVKMFPADWKTYGKGAGPIRNAEMADYCDCGIGFLWDNSRGTANMINQLRNRDKPCFVVPNGNIEEAYWV